MAELLRISDNELTRLARSAVLKRIDDPEDSRAYLYPAFENTRRFVGYLQGIKEKRSLINLLSSPITERLYSPQRTTS